MIKPLNYVTIFLFFLLITSTNYPLFAQQNKQMLMYQIDGNSYIKTSYDKNGNIKSTHLIKAGNLTSASGAYELKVSFYALDENGIAEDSAFTVLSCNPDDAEMLVNIIPLVTDNPGKTIRVVSLSGSESLYPEFSTRDSVQEDMSFKIEVEGGLWGFLGTTSVANIHGRKVEYNEADSTIVTVTSKIELKAYLMRVRIKQMEYVVTEQLQNETGIIEQEYLSDSGERFTITLQQDLKR